MYHGACVVWLDPSTGQLVLTYFDQVSDGDSKQDVGAVFSLCDVILKRLLEANGAIKRVSFQVQR